jgi:hypothetical protein
MACAREAHLQKQADKHTVVVRVFVAAYIDVEGGIKHEGTHNKPRPREAWAVVLLEFLKPFFMAICSLATASHPPLRQISGMYTSFQEKQMAMHSKGFCPAPLFPPYPLPPFPTLLPSSFVFISI